MTKKPQVNSHRCPTCRQDLREPPHRGVNGENCRQCGQGVSWRKAKQRGYDHD